MRARDPDAAFQRYQRRQRPADLAATFDATAPELLRVAAHLAPTLAEAEDLVQETFLVAMDRHADYVPGGAGVLAWLLGVLRHRALRQRRESKRELDGERVLARARSDVEPSVAAQGSELQAEVREAIERVPRAYREALRMHLVEGMSATEIALALQRPAATVRAQIARGLARLRERLPAGLAGSAVALSTERGLAAVRAHLLEQAAARAPLALSAEGVGLAGVLTMKKAMIASALLIAVASLSWYALDASTPMARLPDAGVGATIAAEMQAATPAAESEASSGEDSSVMRAPVPARSASVDDTGDLAVLVAYDTGEAASEVGVTVSRSRTRDGVGLQHATTNRAGRADFTGLPAGSVFLEVDRGPLDREESYANVVAGQRTEVKVTIRVALTLSGEVRDGKGKPVAGADVWLVPLAIRFVDAQPVTRTDANGRFALKSGLMPSLLSARADGYAPSFVQMVTDEKGKSRTDLVLVLPEPGGSVAGVVRGPDGKPVIDVLVRVGSGRLDSVTPMAKSGRPLPAQARSNAEGGFRAVGIPVGAHTITAHGPGTASWSGTCAVRAGETTKIEIELASGRVVFGKVTDAGGQPVTSAFVSTGEEGTLAWTYAWTDREGAYRLEGLAPGAAVITATHASGSARQTLPSVAASQRVDLVTARGQRLLGDLVTLEGAPVGAAFIEVQPEGDDASPASTSRTGPDGRWVIGLAGSGLVRVRARHPGIEPVELEHVDPSAGAVHVSARATGRWALPKAALRGRLLWPDGSPVAGADVELRVSGDMTRTATTEPDGSIRFDGVLPGEGWLLCTAKGHPIAARERCALEPGSTRDLGDVTLPREGGWIQLRCQPPWPGLLAMVSDENDRWCATVWEDTQYRSPPLTPGEYRIRVQGFGIATMTLPATVRLGTDTVVDVRPVAGYEQPFEIGARSGWTSDEVRMEITTEGEPPIVTTLNAEPGRALSWAEFLRLGAHTIRVRSGSEVREARFTVALGAREVVRVVLP